MKSKANSVNIQCSVKDIRVFRYIKYAFKIKLLVEYTSKSSGYK